MSADSSRLVPRLSDRIGVGLLTRAYPPEAVDATLGVMHRVEQRRRLLPARLMVYYVMAMALFRTAAYDEIFRILADGLAWQGMWEPPPVLPTKAALFKARQRLGSDPVRALYEGACGPQGPPRGQGRRISGRRLLYLDAVGMDLPSSAANASAFGWSPPDHSPVRSSPRLVLAGLVEGGTDTIVDAVLGPPAVERPPGAGIGPPGLTRRLLSRLGPGVLCVGGPAPSGVDLWDVAAATGADLLWRLDPGLLVVAGERLPDGSRHARLEGPVRLRGQGQAVRVVAAAPDPPGGRALLVTTITEPDEAPADELAAVVGSTRPMDAAMRDLGFDAARPRIALRSKEPEGVYQEAYGQLLVHVAIRSLLTGSTLSQEVGWQHPRLLS